VTSPCQSPCLAASLQSNWTPLPCRLHVLNMG
jgi:hypothetical protein